MLVIISDLHLGDGTAADSIPASAFYLFAKRLRQDAYFAAMNYKQNEPHGRYTPIETLDVVLMGDILDPLHSIGWLYPLSGNNHPRITEPGGADYIRPWNDPKDPRFAEKLKEVTDAILEHNKEGLQVFRDLAEGKAISFDADDGKGGRLADKTQQRPLKVNFYYMVGNHDWYYHLKGPAFNEIRKTIVDAMGLRNQPDCPFPYDLSYSRPESHAQYTDWKSDMEEGNDDAEKLSRLLQGYKVFARHGDYYDPFNFDVVKGRDYATLGDVFTMEVCNRFSPHLEQKRIDPKTGRLVNDDTMGSPVIEGGNTAYVKELRQITNIRPALATPLWVTGQLKRISQDIVLRRSTKFDEPQIDELLKSFENAPKAIQRESKDLEAKLKEVWDELVDQFMHLDFIRNKDKWGLDVVDKMQLVITISKTISSKQLDELVYMMQNRNATGSDHSFARFALEEPAFNRKTDPAKYIVYGHTHHHEIVPIDYDTVRGKQMYFNSGTWHTYFDLARKNPKEKKFIPYKALTYITFYRPSEHGDQDFETWSGAYA